MGRISKSKNRGKFALKYWQRRRKHCKVPAKRSQHANATCRNIVGRTMLRAFGHRVAMYCDLLGVVGSNLIIELKTKNEKNDFKHLSPGQTIATCQRNISQHCWAQHVACVWPPCCDALRHVGCCHRRPKLSSWGVIFFNKNVYANVQLVNTRYRDIVTAVIYCYITTFRRTWLWSFSMWRRYVTTVWIYKGLYGGKRWRAF